MADEDILNAIATLRGALEYYANRHNWEHVGHGIYSRFNSYDLCQVDYFDPEKNASVYKMVCGRRARKALKEVKKLSCVVNPSTLPEIK